VKGREKVLPPRGGGGRKKSRARGGWKDFGVFCFLGCWLGGFWGGGVGG